MAFKNNKLFISIRRNGIRRSKRKIFPPSKLSDTSSTDQNEIKETKNTLFTVFETKNEEKKVNSCKLSKKMKRLNKPYLKDAPDWNHDKLLELVTKVDQHTPEKDHLIPIRRCELLNWRKISDGLSCSPEDCKRIFIAILAKTKLRLSIGEKVNIAKQMLQNRIASQEGLLILPKLPHNEIDSKRKDQQVAAVEPVKPAKLKLSGPPPKLPLNEVDLFYFDMKDEIEASKPRGMLGLGSKYVLDLYFNLPDEEKLKYIRMAEEESRRYDAEVKKFYENIQY